MQWKTSGEVSITFEQQAIHGNVDGGHTLRLILAAQSEGNLPEQYVEFEVIVGLEELFPIAEARNTNGIVPTLHILQGLYILHMFI